MKISPIVFNSNYNLHSQKTENCQKIFETKNESPYTSANIVANYFINFTSFKHDADDENLFLDTLFYRDLSTLLGFTDLLKDEFPNGTDIMDFACSNGEEAISLYSLINGVGSQNKYKLHCYDKSDTALKFAKNNVHSVMNEAFESFLLDSNHSNKIYNELSSKFYEIMEEVPYPDEQFNDEIYMNYMRKSKSFKEKFFKIKDEYIDNFNFQKGDIMEIADIQPDKQVGVVFFRNALYHLTNNHIFEGIYDRETLDKIWFTNKEAVLQKFVDNVYEKLLPGGFLVLGNDVKEHIYQADKYTPKKEVYYDDSSREYICLKSPLIKALKKDGRFVPVHSSTCYSSKSGEFTVNTIWQKVSK